MTLCNPSRTLIATAFVLALAQSASAIVPAKTGASTQSAALDANLYINYTLGTAMGSWMVCGHTQTTSGCGGHGSLGTFGHAGAYIEGEPVTDSATSTVTRNIYIVDQAVKGGTKVALDVVQIQIQVNPDNWIVTATPGATIDLPLVGGPNAKTFLAANNGYLYIGTDQDTRTVRVTKSNNALHTIPGTVSATPVSSITTNQYGYVSVAYGGITGTDGYAVFDPSGNTIANGAGALFLLGTQDSLRVASLLKHTPATTMDPRVHYDARIRVDTQVNTAPDAGLYDAWSFNGALTGLTWNVCGTVSGSTGCYATGKIGGFGHIGAVLEGRAAIRDAHTVNRHIYVIDQANGGGTSTAVRLHDYLLTEAVNAPNVTATMKEYHVADFNLTGGTAAKSYLAANPGYLFIGTDQSNFEVQLAKSYTFAQGWGGWDPPLNGSGIWANANGYVALLYGSLINAGGFIFGPNDVNGHYQQVGGASAVLGTQQGHPTTDAGPYTTASVVPDRRP